MSESLVIEIEAKVQAADKQIGNLTKRIDDLEGATDSADSGMNKFGATASKAAGSIVKAGTAVIGAATALAAFVNVAASSQREFEQLSKQAGETFQAFEGIAFAMETAGVSAEQYADISKDVKDKIGEFATAGTGAFQDFADVVGMSTEEAQKFAQEMAGLTSTQVIQEVSNQLESVGASAEQTTFVLESLGSDLSKTSDLFADNGKKLDELRGRYDEFNSSLGITDQQSADLKELALTFDLVQKQVGNAGTQVASVLAPAFNNFFNGVLATVPQATQVVIDFLNSFMDPGQIGSISFIDAEIEKTIEKVNEIQFKLANMPVRSTLISNELYSQMDDATERLDALYARKDELEQQDLSRQEEINQSRLAIESSYQQQLAEVKDEANLAEQEKILERLMSDEERMIEKFNRELELLSGNKEAQEALYAEMIDNFNAMDQKRMNEREKNAEKEKRLDKKRTREQTKIQEDYVNAAVTLGNVLFEDNKAVRAGLVVVDAAAGIMRAFAELPYPAALAASASIAATGVAQLAAIQSASKGGGGSPSAPSAADLPQPEQQAPELTATESDTSGANNVMVIKFESSDDNKTAEFINGIMNDARTTGVIS